MQNVDGLRAQAAAQETIDRQAARVRAALVDFPDCTVEGLCGFTGEGMIRVKHKGVESCISGDDAAQMSDEMLRMEFHRALERSRLRAAVTAARELTPQQVLQISIDAGIHNADGSLTEKYLPS